MNEIAVRRVVIAVVVLSLSGCDLVKKLADKEDKGGASGQTGTASADPDGLPQECVDYLAIFKCVNAKNNPATAQSQVDGLRVGFKAVVTNSGREARRR